MSIRWRDGRPIVEAYNPATRKKEYVKPADYGMSFRGLEGRTLERAARTLEQKALDAHERGEIGGDETCDAFAARWTDDFPRGESTNAWHQERLKKFAEDFKGRPLRSVSRVEAREWGRTNSTRVPSVRTMFSDAVSEGLVAENVFAGLTRRNSRGRKDIAVLTADEVTGLAETAYAVHGKWGVEFASMILWAAYTCMRPGEIYDARYSLLDGDTYEVRTQFHSGLRKTTGPKHGSTGTIYVPEPALEAVLARPRRLGDDLMFRTRTGRQFTQGTLHYAWNPVRTVFVSKLPATHHLRQRSENLDFYELRHFGASYLLNDLEMEPWVVAEQLRHSDGGRLISQLYGHPDRKKAIDRMRRAHTSGENIKKLSPQSGEVRGNQAGEAR